MALVERSWCGLTPAGGAETMMRDLVHTLVDRGWTATAIVIEGTPVNTRIDGVDVVTPGDKHSLHALVKQADLIITQLGGTPRATAMGRVYGIPVVQLIHNTSRYSVAFLGERCDYAVYNSQWVADYHAQEASSPLIHLWDNPKNTYIRPRKCYDWESTIVRPPVLSPVKRRSDGEYITLVNLTPNKGPDLFYRIAQQNPDLRFMAVIGGYEPDKQDVRQLPNVLIHDHVKDVSEIYSKTRLVLMPSIYESYGRIAVEALQYGIPSVVSDTPGLREALGGTGVYCQQNDTDGWSAAIRKTLNQYDERRLAAYSHHTALYKQSVVELDQFAHQMKAVVDGAPEAI